MPFCPSCGTSVDGRFCPKCGTAVGAPAGGPPPPSPSPSAPAAGLQENVASALCYALGLITGILFLVLEPYNRNRNIRFHAFQSIFAHAVVIVFYIVLGFLIFGWYGFTFYLWWLLRLAMFVGWLILIIKTYQGQKIVLPVIGPMAEKQASGGAS